MKILFKKSLNIKNQIMQLEPGKAYVLFVEDEEVAKVVAEAIEAVIGDIVPSPKVLVLPVNRMKPRILYFE